MALGNIYGSSRRNTSMKKCPKCNQTKPFDQFGVQKRSPSGLKSWCKDCNNKANRDYYKSNKAKIDAKNAAWHKANPGASNRYSEKWKFKNPDKVKAQKQKWRNNNKEKIALQRESWRKANREKDRLYASTRRARKKQNGIFTIQVKEIESMLRKACVYCDKKADSIDHIIPLARGGRHSIGNLAPACLRCNQSKNSRFITEWKLSKVE